MDNSITAENSATTTNNDYFSGRKIFKHFYDASSMLRLIYGVLRYIYIIGVDARCAALM
jgi:hypothetical protein